MLQYKRDALSVALAAAIMLTSAVANAQSTDAAPPQDPAAATTPTTPATAPQGSAITLDRVIVTGIRRGIENAIETKQSSDMIVEAVSAEDIGKLPDTSIAESIARLPGLTAQRVAGRASTISIRGLADDFATTLLNGREQVSSGQNRGAEFDQYPSELVGQVVVYKTPDAALVGQGIAGTVDIQTVRPLSFSGRTMSLNVRGEKNSLGELNPGYDDLGSRFSASYIDQFRDGTIGVALGYARLDSPGQANRWESWGYPQDGNGNYQIGGSKASSSSIDNVRNGLLGVFEFRPNERYYSMVDVYWSKFDVEETSRYVEAGMAWGGFDNGSGFQVPVLSNPVIQNGVIVGGTYTGVKPVIRNDMNSRTDKLLAVGWNNEFKFNDHWTGMADFSYSKADREERVLETYAGTPRNGDPAAGDTVNYTIDLRSGRALFDYGRDYSDPAAILLTDSAGWGQDGYVKYPEYEDTLKSYRFALERSIDSGIFSKFRLGFNKADREKSRRAAEYQLFLKNPPAAAVPSRCLQSPADLGYSGVPASLAYDIDCVFGSMYNLIPNVHPDIFNKTWTVNEDVSTFYAQIDINTDIGPVGLRGNVGVQVVRADQHSDGFAVASGPNTPHPYSAGTSYTDTLPSLNLAFLFPSEQMLRIGLARQMARPRIDQMRANNNYHVEQTGELRGTWLGDGGNPELRPWIANAFDISYEKYFGSKAYFSAAYFFKDLKSYVFRSTVPFDFSGFQPNPTDPIPPSSNIGLFSRPENGDTGHIKGLETAISLPLDMLWAPLEGFGTQLSYSQTLSAVDPDGPEGPESSNDLPGLSKYVSNITLYYERAGFSTRISRRHRSDFRGEVTGFGADRDNRYIAGESVVDFQLGYSFADDTRLKGLSLLLQVNNITNEPYRELFKDRTTGFEAPRQTIEYGRTVLLGATYKF